jgi:hypothetical protein
MPIGARTFCATLKQSANGWGVAVFRDPATEPVDNTAASPVTVSSRVLVDAIRGQGFNGPNADGGHSPSAISGATNAAPIVITQAATAASLGIAAGDFVFIDGVLGNLNANGTFEVTSVSGSTVTLKGSAGSAAYTSGGYIRKLNVGTSWTVAVHALTLGLANDLVKNG